MEESLNEKRMVSVIPCIMSSTFYVLSSSFSVTMFEIYPSIQSDLKSKEEAEEFKRETEQAVANELRLISRGSYNTI